MKAMLRRSLAAIAIAAGLAIQAVASQSALPAAPTFTWGTFGSGLVISPITVQQYVNPDGSAGGSVFNFNAQVFELNPTPLPTDTLVNGLELIGNASFQFVLWKGSATGGVAGATNRFGAALFGGFNLTATDVGTNFSFLQIYTDATSTAGTIDGGGYRGKFNAEIPRYGATPGWDFAGTQYDFFDVPFDLAGNPSESVSFETALVSYTANTVQILGDYTWNFTTGAGGNPQSFLTGAPVAEQPAASATLLDLYGTANPGVTYVQISVPEPSTAGLFVTAGITILLWRDRRGASLR